MGFSSTYKDKLISATDAVSMVNPGDWVDYGAFCCAPQNLDEALALRQDELWDVKVRALAFPGIPAVSQADPDTGRLLYNSWHFSCGESQSHGRGNCHFIPLVYHEGPSHYRRTLQSDVCMLRVAPMDRFGNFNFGMANMFQRAIIENARKVIVEVNEHLPRCLGGNEESVHVSEVDYVVESDNKPLYTLPDSAVTAVDKAIATLIVREIEDGACLQLGLGGLPNAVGKLIARSDLKNLGVHTEMLVDSFREMYEAGKITNSEKARDRGKMVYSCALGGQRLYDFLDNNPVCASYAVDYTNGPLNIAANDGMVSINNALAVDLYGQVSSESAGYRQLTGTGGQLDFAYGAYHSKGGKSFICLPSTTRDRQGSLVSRIQPVFDHGTVVTLPRSITQYVVTEYGMASLKGKSTWERAEALISIAHPRFRDDLVREAEGMGLWSAANRNDEVLHMVGACA